LLAVEELEQCVRVNGKHIRGWRLLGKAYILLGQEAKAIEAFEKVVELAPNHPDSEKLRTIIESYRSR
jgi:cytochrome c-type biogenesis protein CcmH/NrfG